jgi:hypothetical protein
MATGAVGRIPGDFGHDRLLEAGEKKEEIEGVPFCVLPEVGMHRGDGILPVKLRWRFVSFTSRTGRRRWLRCGCSNRVEVSGASVQCRGGLGARSERCGAGAVWRCGPRPRRSTRPLVMLCRAEVRGGKRRAHARRRLRREHAGVGAPAVRVRGGIALRFIGLGLRLG